MSNELQWRKSSFSGTNGDCVELASLSPDHISVRDSKNPDGPHLELSRGELADLLDAVKAGEFDHLT